MIEMEDMHEEVGALRAALLVMVQKHFCHGSDIDKKGLNGFYYAASYLDPTKRQLATVSPTIPSIMLAVIMPSAPLQPMWPYGGIVCCVGRRGTERRGEGEGEKDKEQGYGEGEWAPQNYRERSRCWEACQTKRGRE